MRIEKAKPKTQVITIEEEYTIPGTDIVLEKGDKIEIPLEEEKIEESHLNKLFIDFVRGLETAYYDKGIEYVKQELAGLFRKVTGATESKELFELCLESASFFKSI